MVIWILNLNVLLLQLRRYKTYVYLLSSHMNSNPTDLISIIIGGEALPTTTATTTTTMTSTSLTTQTVGEDLELAQLSSSQQGTNRYSYREAIYRSDAQTEIG